MLYLCRNIGTDEPSVAIYKGAIPDLGKESLMNLRKGLLFLGMFGLIVASFACGNAADKAGIGAECKQDSDCKEEGQKCLTKFKGGYCGSEGCTKDADCPTGALCVTHTDSTNYCFRACTDKAECNVNRQAANESNCSANITLVSGEKNKKACIPPSG